MKRHERSELVDRARLSITQHVTQTWESLGLTAVEVVVVLAALTAEYCKYPLRDERHPNDPSKRAGEA